jgi:hypothetical protein
MLFRSSWLGALAILFAAAPATAATPGDPIEPYSGVVYTVWTTGGSRSTRIHVVELDLSSAELTLVATRSDERGQTVSSFAAARSAQIAINGDFFATSGFVPAGLARGDGASWEDAADDARSGFIQIEKDVSGTGVAIARPAEEIPALGDEIAAAVGGRPQLVLSGATVKIECDDTATLACQAAPRTAVALDASGRRMYLIVADGWQAGSYGVTAAELATFIAVDLDADRALMLDSGSASTLFIENQDGVVSSPSDGVERQVANHLAVKHGALPPGVIQGHVFDTVVGGEPLTGVQVRLDTGEELTYTGDGLWSFVVAPRWVCVTGSHPGYLDQTQCRQILSGEAEFASLALIPEDAPRPDGGGVGGGSDAGVNPGDPRDSGCSAAGSRGGAWLLAVLLLAVAWRRPRSTT